MEATSWLNFSSLVLFWGKILQFCKKCPEIGQLTVLKLTFLVLARVENLLAPAMDFLSTISIHTMRKEDAKENMLYKLDVNIWEQILNNRLHTLNWSEIKGYLRMHASLKGVVRLADDTFVQKVSSVNVVYSFKKLKNKFNTPYTKQINKARCLTSSWPKGKRSKSAYLCSRTKLPSMPSWNCLRKTRLVRGNKHF